MLSSQDDIVNVMLQCYVAKSFNEIFLLIGINFIHLFKRRC